jgi:hypothetical protein
MIEHLQYYKVIKMVQRRYISVQRISMIKIFTDSLTQQSLSNNIILKEHEKISEIHHERLMNTDIILQEFDIMTNIYNESLHQKIGREYEMRNNLRMKYYDTRILKMHRLQTSQLIFLQHCTI